MESRRVGAAFAAGLVLAFISAGSFAQDAVHPLVPKKTPVDESGTGYILYTRTELVTVPAVSQTPLPVAKVFVMCGDGSQQMPLIAPKGDLAFTEARQACWTADGKSILFTSNYDPARSALFTDVFRLDLVKERVQRLTGNEWSAGAVNGTGTIYGVVQAGFADVHPNQVNIAVQGMDGKTFHLTANKKDDKGNIEPGQYVFVIEGVPAGDVWVKCWVSRHLGDMKIVHVSPNKQNLVETMHLSAGNWLATNPSITPDGRYLVILSQLAYYVASPVAAKPGEPQGVKEQGFDTLAVVDLKDDAKCVFLWDPTKNQGLNTKDPKLSPDGKLIAFTLGSPPSESIAICTLQSLLAGRPQVQIVAQGQRVLVGAPSVAYGQAAWSRDGKRLAFTRTLIDLNMNFCTNLCVANIDGTGLKCITQANVNQAVFGPCWSPDGKRIACSLLTSKRNILNVLDVIGLNFTSDIYTIGADGTDVKRLTTDCRSSEPSWGP